MASVYTVSQVTAYIRNMFTQDFALNRISIRGEVSNCKYHTSGHIYFTLKDGGAQIAAVMFAGQRKGLDFELREGQEVTVSGTVDVYERDGRYQLYAKKITREGKGDLFRQFEKLRNELEEMGMFDSCYKQPIPRYARKVGIVTAGTGAAIRDIMNISARRNPYVQLILYPALVQGEQAKYSIAKGIETLDRMGLDVLIVGRGGGSIEDLWAFNEEIVVQSIFESRLPVISSVGHETDTTLADFVADRRAATPTAAAELATPVSKADTLVWIRERQNRAYQACLRRIQYNQERLAKLSQSVVFRQPERLYDGYLQKLDRLTTRLETFVSQDFDRKQKKAELLKQRLQGLNLLISVQNYQDRRESLQRLLVTTTKNTINGNRVRLEKAQDALLSLDTSRIVARGYAIVKKDDKPLTSTKNITEGDQLTVQMRDGELEVEVKNVN